MQRADTCRRSRSTTTSPKRGKISVRSHCGSLLSLRVAVALDSVVRPQESKPAVSIAPRSHGHSACPVSGVRGGDVDAIAVDGGRIERLPGLCPRPPDANLDRGRTCPPLVRRRWRGPAARSLREVVLTTCSLSPPAILEGNAMMAGKSHMVSTSATMPARQNVRANVSDGFRLA